MIPYMAVTAHWIQSVRVDHVSGRPTEDLILRADLIGFHHLPGHHTGKHIAQLFLFITDRIGITDKVRSFGSFLIDKSLTSLHRLVWLGHH